MLPKRAKCQKQIRQKRIFVSFYAYMHILTSTLRQLAASLKIECRRLRKQVPHLFSNHLPRNGSAPGDSSLHRGVKKTTPRVRHYTKRVKYRTLRATSRCLHLAIPYATLKKTVPGDKPASAPLQNLKPAAFHSFLLPYLAPLPDK